MMEKRLRADEPNTEKPRAMETMHRPDLGDRLAFLRAFLRSPRQVGSVVPSSRFLERRLVALSAVAGARTIVELRAQATLATRPPKEVQSLADLTACWRHRAAKRLGAEPTGWSQSVIGRDGDLKEVVRSGDQPHALASALTGRARAAPEPGQ